MTDCPVQFGFVDIGNSWIKCCYSTSPDGALSKIERMKWSESLELPLADGICHWFVACVSGPGRERFQNLLDSRPRDTISDIGFADLDLMTNLDSPEKTGIDRLCAARGAMEYVRPNDHASPIVVADIGTAVTVDALSAKNEFLGGTIFLGPVKSLQELSEQTDALPDVSDFQMEEKLDPIGRNTSDALKAGVIYSLVGGIKEIVLRQAEEFDGQPQVLVTGGGSPYVASFIPENWQIVDDLVIRGVQAAAQKILERHDVRNQG